VKGYNENPVEGGGKRRFRVGSTPNELGSCATVGKPGRQNKREGNPHQVLAHATCLNALNPRTVRQRCRRVSLRRRLRTRRAVAPQRTASQQRSLVLHLLQGRHCRYYSATEGNRSGVYCPQGSGSSSADLLTFVLP
jgi:hypothetical protein